MSDLSPRSVIHAHFWSRHLVVCARLLVLTAIVASRPVWAELPKAVDALPLFAGARPANDPEAECAAPGCRLYKVPRPIEEVLQFYRQRFAPRESNVLTIVSSTKLNAMAENNLLAKANAQSAFDNSFADASNVLKPGLTTPVFLKVITSSYSTEYIPKEVEAQYKAGRAPYSPGQWVASAEFRWTYESPGGEATTLSVTLADVLELKVAGAHQTLVRLAQGTTSSPAAADQPPAEPSASDLGMPAYPGSKFDPMSSHRDESGAQYVYLSADAAQKVVRFYEGKLGKRAQEPGDGRSTFVLKGTMDEPIEAIEIMPNPSTGKTEITIFRSVK